MMPLAPKIKGAGGEVALTTTSTPPSPTSKSNTIVPQNLVGTNGSSTNTIVEDIQVTCPTFKNPDAYKYWKVFEKLYGFSLFFHRDMFPRIADKYKYAGGNELLFEILNEWKTNDIAIVLECSKRKDQKRYKIRFIKSPPTVLDDVETFATTITLPDGTVVDPLENDLAFYGLMHKPSKGTKATKFCEWRNCALCIHPRKTAPGNWWRATNKETGEMTQSNTGFSTELEAAANMRLHVLRWFR